MVERVEKSTKNKKGKKTVEMYGKQKGKRQRKCTGNKCKRTEMQKTVEVHGKAKRQRKCMARPHSPPTQKKEKERANRKSEYTVLANSDGVSKSERTKPIGNHAKRA
jgi:ribosome biogenesis protein Tsr3